MITEILGALIVLGAVLVLIMRRLLSKGKAKEKESVEVSASRLRYEIERSGDAVIGRMQIHVERLERILAEANAQKAALDERLAALAQWEKVYGARLGALPQQMEFASSAPRTATQAPPAVSPVTAAPAVSSPSAVEVAASSAAAVAPPAAASAVGAGETAASFQAALMKQMAGSPIGGAVDLQLPPEEMETDAAANIAHGVQAAQGNMRREIPVQEDAASRALSAAQMPDEMQDDETQDDEAYEYEEDESEEEDEGAVMEEEADEYEEDEPADEEETPEFSHEDLTAVREEDEADDVKSPSPDAPPSRQQEQIRAFLRQGMSAEEISQRLGLGLGAIELVRHMEKRAHEE